MTDPKSPSDSVTQGSTVASLGIVATTTAATGHYMPVVVQRPAVEIAPPEHPIYALIGRAASAWAHLEHTLDLIIWDLSPGAQQRVACITAQILGGTKSSFLFLNSAKILNSTNQLKTSKKLMRKTYDPIEDRNRIIHDPWYLYNTQVAQFRAMPPKDPRFGVCKIDIVDIEKFLATAHALADRAAEIRQEILIGLVP